MATVLVTGGSGFLAGHTIQRLLAAGHAVRATVRDVNRTDRLRQTLVAETDADARLSFVEADLGHDDGWARAAAACDYVLHLASPFPAADPKNEDELIRPAREGTLRVLRAARDAKVDRVVMTSSFAAVGYGHKSRQEQFTEADWTDVDGPGVQAYIKSKALAERAAWDFVTAEGGGMTLTTINPVGIFGPLLGGGVPSSVQLIQQMLTGAMPAAPRIAFGLVDVRDVADLHLRAMTAPEAAGERFIAVSGEPMWMIEVARSLRAALGDSAAKAPTIELSDEQVRALAAANPALQSMVPQLGIVRRASSQKAQRLLGWLPRGNDEIIAATGEALVRLQN